MLSRRASLNHPLSFVGDLWTPVDTLSISSMVPSVGTNVRCGHLWMGICAHLWASVRICAHLCASVGICGCLQLRDPGAYRLGLGMPSSPPPHFHSLCHRCSTAVTFASFSTRCLCLVSHTCQTRRSALPPSGALCLETQTSCDYTTLRFAPPPLQPPPHAHPLPPPHPHTHPAVQCPMPHYSCCCRKCLVELPWCWRSLCLYSGATHGVALHLNLLLLNVTLRILLPTTLPLPFVPAHRAHVTQVG